MSITPGPWKVRGGEGDDWHNAAYGIMAENGDLVGFVMRRGTKEGLSNANAIAAMPEMVDVLKDMATMVEVLRKMGLSPDFVPIPQSFLKAIEILRQIEGGRSAA